MLIYKRLDFIILTSYLSQVNKIENVRKLLILKCLNVFQ